MAGPDYAETASQAGLPSSQPAAAAAVGPKRRGVCGGGEGNRAAAAAAASGPFRKLVVCTTGFAEAATVRPSSVGRPYGTGQGTGRCISS